MLLAIDTFFQQVVTLPDRWKLHTLAAAAPKAYVYEPRNPVKQLDGIAIAQHDRDTFHIIETFSYGNGTQPVSFGNGTRPEIPVVRV
jgi:hypothetical protein